MVKSKKIRSAMIVLIALNLFTGLAVAADVYAEPPDVSDQKGSAYTINCPNYDISLFIGGDISSGSDADRYKCGVNSGDVVNTWIDTAAFNSGVSSYEDDQAGNFAERNQLNAYSGDGIIHSPPVYSKLYNSRAVSYNGYEFFLARNWYI